MSVSAAWKSLSKVPGEVQCVVECHFGDKDVETNVIRISTRDLSLSDGKFTGVLVQIPRTRQSWDLQSHGYSIGNSGLMIDNKLLNSINRFSDYFQAGSGNKRGLTNRKVDIRLWKEGITSFEDCYKLFPDGVMGHPKHNGLNLSVPVRDRTELALADMTDPITAADGVGGILPSSTLGKRKTMLRGDHRLFINANDSNGLSAAEWDISKENNLSPMEELGGNEWFVSRDIAKDLPTDSLNITNGVTIWAYDGDLDDYVEVVDWTLVQNTIDGAIISIDSDSYYAYFPIVRGVSLDWGNPSNIAFGDISTFTTATIDTGDPGGTTETLAMSYPGAAVLMDDDVIARVDVYLKYDHDGLTSNLSLRVGDRPYLAVGSTDDFRKSNTGMPLPLTGAFDMTYLKEDPGAESGTQTCYAAYLRVEYANNNLLPLFGGVLGKPDGSNDLIENPAEISEDGLRSRGGYGDAEIDIAMFAQSAIDTAGFEQSFSESNNPRIVVWLAEIARQSKSYIWRGLDNKWKMQTILDDYSDATVIPIKYDDAIKIDFKRMDPKNIVTDVDVEYNFNGDFTSRTDGATDADAREASNVTIDESHRSVQAQNFGAKVPVDNYEAFFLDFWKNEKNVAKFTMDLSYTNIALGSIVVFPDYPRLVEGEDITIDNVRGGQTILKEFVVYSVDTGIDNIFKAMQLPQL